jgi:hypothetical protein
MKYRMKTSGKQKFKIDDVDRNDIRQFNIVLPRIYALKLTRNFPYKYGGADCGCAKNWRSPPT